MYTMLMNIVYGVHTHIVQGTSNITQCADYIMQCTVCLNIILFFDKLIY